MNLETGKLIVAVIVLGSTVGLVAVSLLGLVTPTPEVALFLGYLTGEARQIISGYFAAPKEAP